MCRIVGFLDLNYKSDYDFQDVVIAMRDTMIHGGPDDAGFYIDLQNNLALGHRRLSILDLSPAGHQPMEFENLVIIYNGEVYNFQEIRNELETYGYRFDSDSDTEVVLKAFHKWRFEAVHKFRGMFAFAIWDKNRKRLILCRDRIGVKPLYWYYKDGLFMFSSELKAFHKHPKFRKNLNHRALALFLQYGYIIAPYSIFDYTYKLEPGYFLIFESDGSIERKKYWDVKEYFLEGVAERDRWSNRPEEELIEELEGLLVESFKLRLVSDVPVGMFLSGGIDSTTVSVLLSKEGIKLKTFTIGFYEKDYNEAPHAKKIARYCGTDHTELYCTFKEALDTIFKLPEIYDEPFGDPSAIPTYLVSKLARAKVKVSLSADGGDEQFCGYKRYYRINKLNEFPFKKGLSFLLNLLNPDLALRLYDLFKPLLPKYTNFKDKYIKLKNILQERDLLIQYDISLKVFLKEELKKLGLKPNNSIISTGMKGPLDLFSLLMLIDLKTYLPDDILVKLDRATMSVSLEGREPFLDHKIVEWTSKLPYRFKYRSGKSKYLLRKILYKYIPSELVNRPKQGFAVPIYEWFKKDLKELYLEYLNEDRIKREGVFNPSEIKRLSKEYFENKGINHNKLWLLFIFEGWRERWMQKG